MANTITSFLLATSMAIGSCFPLNAQINRTTAAGNSEGGTDLLTIDNLSVRITNLYTLDSFRAPHIASFDLELSSQGNSKKILLSLLSAAQGAPLAKLVFSNLSMQNHVIGDKSYKSVSVTEILFPDLNGSSKDVAKFRVKIQAADVAERSNINEAAGQVIMTSRGALCSNFKLVVGNLPAQRVVAINNFRINNQQANGYINFSVEIQRADAKAWKDWFTSGAGGAKRENATISLLDPGFQSEVASLQLSEVEIVSVSETNSSQDLLKTVIGLRTRKIDTVK